MWTEQGAFFMQTKVIKWTCQYSKLVTLEIIYVNIVKCMSARPNLPHIHIRNTVRSVSSVYTVRMYVRT